MKPDINAEAVSRINMKSGETIKMGSLKKAVVPPFVMMVPFIELPGFIELSRQDNLEEEGVHGCTFTLKALKPGTGEIITGFRDLREGTTVMVKHISIEVVP
ncbi:MAG: hypothetical protein H7Z13_14270 [Ferruginibacter sp.]|nr:hypothetical protein [Ferruginibacter sp.]